MLRVTQAGTEDAFAVGDDIERGHLLGQVDGVGQRKQHHPGNHSHRRRR